MRDEEIVARLFGLREELMRQMAQFERDKVIAEDERARGAIKSLIEQVGEIAGELGELQGKMARVEATVVGLMEWRNQTELALDKIETDIVVAQGDIDGLQSAVAALTARVTLCEGRIGRLEAKP